MVKGFTCGKFVVGYRQVCCRPFSSGVDKPFMVVVKVTRGITPCSPRHALEATEGITPC